MAARKKPPLPRKKKRKAEKPRMTPPSPKMPEPLRQAALGVLGRIEENPEQVLEDLKALGAAAGRVLERAYARPDEAKRTLIQAAARIVKERL